MSHGPWAFLVGKDSGTIGGYKRSSAHTNVASGFRSVNVFAPFVRRIVLSFRALRLVPPDVETGSEPDRRCIENSALISRESGWSSLCQNSTFVASAGTDTGRQSFQGQTVENLLARQNIARITAVLRKP